MRNNVKVAFHVPVSLVSALFHLFLGLSRPFLELLTTIKRLANMNSDVVLDEALVL
jgi:hypothetical protein